VPSRRGGQESRGDATQGLRYSRATWRWISFACTSEVAESPPREALELPARNLLMISIDTLRRDVVGRYGGGDDTPFLDELAGRGLALDRHDTCSAWTFPESICAMSGRPPYYFGVMPRVVVGQGADSIVPLPADAETLAVRLSAAGFQSFLNTTNVWIGTQTNLAVGYDRTVGIQDGAAGPQLDSTLSLLEDGVIDLDRPWFAHVHLRDPHAPYAPPSSYLTELEGREALLWDLGTEEGWSEFQRDRRNLSAQELAEAITQLKIRYEGEVRYMDQEIQRFYMALEERGLVAGTLVVVWSDHGEQFTEHGAVGHNNNLNVEENAGIALFSGPKVPVTAWTGGTTSIDLVPTILSLLELPVPADLPGVVAGLGTDERPRTGVLWPTDQPPIQSVNLGTGKLVYRWSGRASFYDRQTDPEERKDIYDLQRADVQQAWEVMRAEVAALQPYVPGETPLGMP
jgi:arylsulfatase A-like enzyme